MRALRSRFDFAFGVGIAGGASLIVLTLAIIARDYPFVGHDYRYYVPRLLDTNLYLRLNGLTVQWFTPSFGGGVPAFPNPQHLEFSIIQALSYVFNPWWATLLTIAAAMSLGGLAFHRVLRRLGLSPFPAILGALFFLGNGFYIEHMIAGHVGFQLYPLGAVILLVLTDRRLPIVAAASMVALIVAAMVLHAGVHIVILLSGAILLAIIVLALVRPAAVEFRRVAFVTGVAVAITLCLLGAKLHASLAMLALFPREVADHYDVSLPQALVGLVAQLGGAMTVSPFLIGLGLDLTPVASALEKLTGASVRVGIWELDTALTPVMIAALAMFAFRGVKQLRSGSTRLARNQVLMVAALLVITWIAVEATLARGLVYPLLKQLPILRSLHVNHRIASVFIMPLAIVAAIEVEQWHQRNARAMWMVLLVVLTVAAPASYLYFPTRVHQRSFDISQSLADQERFRAGATSNITRIADIPDEQALTTQASSRLTYEPLFGYANEDFQAEVRAGDIWEVRDGHFNMTNPASLVYPQMSGLRRFERFKVEERGQLELFAAHRLMEWSIPASQFWLQLLSVVAIAFSVASILASRVK